MDKTKGEVIVIKETTLISYTNAFLVEIPL